MANRAQYPDPVKELVKRKYPLCRSRADREALTRECDALVRQLNPEAKHPPMTLQKLYNLASRLEATRGHANTHLDWCGDEDQGYDAKDDKSRLYLRDDPDSLTWSDSDDRYLREHWRHTWIEQIGYMLNRSETAIAYRARQLALRNVPKYYDIEKVAAWLGVSLKETRHLLVRQGLEVFDCCDRQGRVQITLVSTVSLARVLVKSNFWKVLVDRRGADQFFIKDIIESMVAIQDEEASWEPNVWVSHGHTCLNPFSESCFGWFFDGYDTKMAGYDMDPTELAPSRDITSDNYRRGVAGQTMRSGMPVKVAA